MPKMPLGGVCLVLGGTEKFSIVKVGPDFYLENNQDLEENIPRTKIPEDSVNLYINQLESYLDEDPDNSESSRMFNEDLFDTMCDELFASDNQLK